MLVELTGWALFVTIGYTDPILMQDHMRTFDDCRAVARMTTAAAAGFPMTDANVRAWCVPRYRIRREQ